MHRRSKSIDCVRKQPQNTYINYREVKKLEHHHDIYLIILIGKQTVCFVVRHILLMRSILKEKKASTVEKGRIIETLSLTNVKAEREREREKDDEEARVIEHRFRNCFEFIAAEYRHRNMYLSLFILQVKMKKCGTMHER